MAKNHVQHKTATTEIYAAEENGETKATTNAHCAHIENEDEHTHITSITNSMFPVILHLMLMLFSVKLNETEPKKEQEFSTCAH